MALNLKQCDGECLTCIKSYTKKHDLKPGNKFKIKCDGIPKANIVEQIDLFDLQEESVQAADNITNPVKWAAATLDWHCLDPKGEVWKRKNPDEYYAWVDNHPDEDILGHSRYHRPYQSTMLSCTSRRKVSRIGRQCLVGDTKVSLSDGTFKDISEVRAGDTVLSLEEGSSRQILAPVLQQWYAGKKDVFLVKTRFGREVECTSDHRFYASNTVGTDGMDVDWLSIDTGLHPGTKIAIPNTSKHVNENESIGAWAPFLGYFLSDGSASWHQSAKFTNINMDYLLEFEALSVELGTACKWYKKGKGYDLIITNGRRQNNPVRSRLKELGLTDIRGPEKFIPDFVMAAPDEDVKIFLNRAWSADGYISTFKRSGRKSFKTEIGIMQESLKFTKQIQNLLLRFGVTGFINKEGNAYRLVVSNKYGILQFLKEIGPIFGKEPACEKALKYTSLLSDKFTTVDGDILWDYISSVTPIGKKKTYDIEVDGTHNFIANGIYSHNSGKTEALVITVLFAAFTQPNTPKDKGFDIIIIAPYQSQIEMIFKRIEELIATSPLTANSVKRSVKAPFYTIELHNKSTIKGFTAASKSGGNAESVRGMTAQMLVFDEADYLNGGDVEAALNIVTNHPNATIWMSSTPTGRREKFYNTCHSSLWKEFHYPSYVNPMWDAEMEEMFKEQLTSAAYDHEVLALFGDQEQGVFQNALVQAAKATYNYGDYPYQSSWMYMMGVDWNDTANGTRIVVVGFNPNTNIYYIVHKDKVQRVGWTQLSAVQKIVELNRIWHPQGIYVDSGFGSTQDEILRQEGYNAAADPTRGPMHPDSKLKDIVKKYEFGSAIEIRDLFTKEPIKKPAKPFLVENTLRFFESNQIRYPETDTVVEAQLLNYVIDRITPTGTPVYKARDEAIGDHDIDALFVAMVAFTLEATPFGKPVFSSRISFAGNFGQKQVPIGGSEDLGQSTPPPSEPAGPRPTMGRTEVFKPQQLSLFNNLPATTTKVPTMEYDPDDWIRDKHPGSRSKTRRPILRSKSYRPTRKNI